MSQLWKGLAIGLIATSLVACKDGEDETDDTDVADTDDTDVTGNGSVTLNGNDYQPHFDNSHYMYVGLFDGTGTAVAPPDIFELDDVDFTVTFADVPFGTYELTWFADFDGDQGCDEAPTDHVWTREVVVDGDETVDHTHASDFGACGSWAP